MLRTFLPFSRVVSGRWPPAKNRLSPGSNPARSLIPRTDSKCYSRRKRTLWPWFFNISIPRMLVFIHVWLRLPREKFHAQLNYPWKVEWPNYWRCLIKKKHTQCLKITQNCESSSSKRTFFNIINFDVKIQIEWDLFGSISNTVSTRNLWHLDCQISQNWWRR